MTDQSSPITPPPELVQQWKRTAPHPTNKTEHYHYIILCAVQWGADQELEACIELLRENGWHTAVRGLRAARRPKPPTLKEKALAAAARFYSKGHEDCTEQEVRDDYDNLCRALEALPND